MASHFLDQTLFQGTVSDPEQTKQFDERCILSRLLYLKKVRCNVQTKYTYSSFVFDNLNLDIIQVCKFLFFVG